MGQSTVQPKYFKGEIFKVEPDLTRHQGKKQFQPKIFKDEIFVVSQKPQKFPPQSVQAIW